jgi:hypothetical protein
VRDKQKKSPSVSVSGLQIGQLLRRYISHEVSRRNFQRQKTPPKNFATQAPRPRSVAFEHFVVNHRIATLAPGRVLHSFLGEGGPRPSEASPKGSEGGREKTKKSPSVSVSGLQIGRVLRRSFSRSRSEHKVFKKHQTHYKTCNSLDSESDIFLS